MRPRRSSPPMSSSIAASNSFSAVSCWLTSRLRRRSRSIARCFAVPISQAPGLAGMPDSGHCSRAATSASCASSSATPTSPTIRANPAISRADSIRQTASIVRWVSDVSGLGGRLRPPALVLLPQLGRVRLPEVVRLEHLANFDLTVVAGGIGDALDPFDRLFPRLHLPDPEAGDELLRLGEGPVDDGPLPAREFDARAL